MAIIGFLFLLVVGTLFVGSALVTARLSAGFGGKVEWPTVLVLGGIGAAILRFAWTHAPFTISMTGG